MTWQVGSESGSIMNWQVGSGSEINSFGSATLLKSKITIFYWLKTKSWSIEQLILRLHPREWEKEREKEKIRKSGASPLLPAPLMYFSDKSNKCDTLSVKIKHLGGIFSGNHGDKCIMVCLYVREKPFQRKTWKEIKQKRKERGNKDKITFRHLNERKSY